VQLACYTVRKLLNGSMLKRLRGPRNLVFLCLVLAVFRGQILSQNATVRLAEEEVRQAATMKVDPEYAPLARQLRIEGEVQVEVTIAASGTVEKVSVLRGNTLLSSAVVSAVKRWRFNPFLSASKPVRVVAPMRFTFRM
jgi:TonB family protein